MLLIERDFKAINISHINSLPARIRVCVTLNMISVGPCELNTSGLEGLWHCCLIFSDKSSSEA